MYLKIFLLIWSLSYSLQLQKQSMSILSCLRFYQPRLVAIFACWSRQGKIFITTEKSVEKIQTFVIFQTKSIYTEKSKMKILMFLWFLPIQFLWHLSTGKTEVVSLISWIWTVLVLTIY